MYSNGGSVDIISVVVGSIVVVVVAAKCKKTKKNVIIISDNVEREREHCKCHEGWLWFKWEWRDKNGESIKMREFFTSATSFIIVSRDAKVIAFWKKFLAKIAFEL